MYKPLIATVALAITLATPLSSSASNVPLARTALLIGSMTSRSPAGLLRPATSCTVVVTAGPVGDIFVASGTSTGYSMGVQVPSNLPYGNYYLQFTAAQYTNSGGFLDSFTSPRVLLGTPGSYTFLNPQFNYTPCNTSVGYMKSSNTITNSNGITAATGSVTLASKF